MELYQLQQFVAIAHSGSISAAADKMLLSQSALSQNLKKLERELGCTLLDRTRSPLQMTPYGEIALAHAERILFQADELRNDILARRELDARKVRVGCFYEIVANSCMPLVAQSFPELYFDVEKRDEKSVKDGLLQGRYDFAVLPGSRALPGFRRMALVEERVFLSIPDDGFLPEAESFDLAEFPDLEIVIPDSLTGITDWYENLISDAGLPPERVRRLPLDEYFVFLESPDAAHLRTSLMSAPIGAVVHRRHVALSGNGAARMISVYFDASRKDETVQVAKYIESNGKRLVGAMSSLSHLLHAGELSNLTIA